MKLNFYTEFVLARSVFISFEWSGQAPVWSTNKLHMKLKRDVDELYHEVL